MRRYLCAHVALLVGVAATTAAAEPNAGPDPGLSTAAQAFFFDDVEDDEGGNDDGVATTDFIDAIDGDVELASFASTLGPALGSAGGRGQYFVGAEYVSVRASFSQATAFLTTNIASNPPSFTYNEFDFNYEPSFRVYGGYRDPCCGCEIRFTYSNLNSDGSFDSGPQPTDGSLTFTSPGEVITGGPGDSVSGDASVDIDDYDLGFSRTIPLGSPLGGCGCSDGCCGDCGPWCPAWDLTWTGAVRIADVNSQLNFASNIVSTSVPGLLSRTASSTVDFQGFGLRTGLLGRRYFGKSGVASMYVKGDISLLLGEVEYNAVGTQFAQHTLESTQIVPVTELEVGGTVFVTSNLSVTGGYFLAAWHDLGHRGEYDFGAAGVQLESLDDANILGLDGWFVRAELAY